MRRFGAFDRRYIGVEVAFGNIPRPYVDGALEEDHAWISVGIRAPGSEAIAQIELKSTISKGIYEALDWLLADRDLKGWCSSR